MRSGIVSISAALAISFLTGCAFLSAGVVGSKAWFDDKKADVSEKATVDLACKEEIQYVSVGHDDYREVEAHGCGKKATYKFVKVGPVSGWEKSTDVTPM
jgi:hypothetical protein